MDFLNLILCFFYLLVEAEKVLSNAELASGEQIGIKILDSQITALEAELERYSNLKIRLYQDLCDDVVSREEYGEMNTRFYKKCHLMPNRSQNTFRQLLTVYHVRCAAAAIFIGRAGSVKARYAASHLAGRI